MPITNGKYTTPAWANGQAPAIGAAELKAMGQGIEQGSHAYAVCGTAAGTQAKAVTIDVSGTVTRFAGMGVTVKFTYGNTAANPTLNVNSTGAAPILLGGTPAGSGAWGAGQVVTLTFDGTNWNMQGAGQGSTSAAGLLQLTDSTSSTSTTTAATPNSVRAAYNLADTANTNAGSAATAAASAQSAAQSAQQTADSASQAAAAAQQAVSGKIVASTTPLTPGTSTLASGVLYVVYE